MGEEKKIRQSENILKDILNEIKDLAYKIRSAEWHRLTDPDALSKEEAAELEQKIKRNNEKLKKKIESSSKINHIVDKILEDLRPKIRKILYEQIEVGEEYKKLIEKLNELTALIDKDEMSEYDIEKKIEEIIPLLGRIDDIKIDEKKLGAEVEEMMKKFEKNI